MTVDRQEISLLIMAGGLGSRFGGNKQLVAVGPNGEAFLDYAINDAHDLGLGQVVIVARTDLQTPLRAHLDAQHGEDFPVTNVHQDTYGPTRAKPWGTGHAVLSATSALTGPVVVVNADDHYGSTGIAQAVKALEGTESNSAVLVAFELGRTLSATGSVSRGVCRISQGRLEELVETHGIRAEGDRILADDPSGELPADAPVSMNLWGLSGEAVDRLAGQWASFYAQNSDDPSAEFLLPEALDQQRAEGLLEVLVVRSKEKWTGVTSRKDLKAAQAAFAG